MEEAMESFVFLNPTENGLNKVESYIRVLDSTDPPSTITESRTIVSI
jgi:hypothetical protein